ncbi:MAG TPA: BlaI/MecI/CopY family transcriptional regulator [Streptosporangiaceae bacterium]|nr:BlaI/MecI/CopY family transcriptional regulator [Streptosporangiaceae bacterium]
MVLARHEGPPERPRARQPRDGAGGLRGSAVGTVRGGAVSVARREAAGAQGRRAAGELEAEVLAVLLRADAALTPRDVRAQLGGGLAYSTVVTILSRLHAKGVLTRRRTRRAYAYAPVADESGLAARRMRQVLDGEADREAVLEHFVSDLSDQDEQLLHNLLLRGGTAGRTGDRRHR